jgi:hypothetical protein
MIMKNYFPLRTGLLTGGEALVLWGFRKQESEGCVKVVLVVVPWGRKIIWKGGRYDRR